VVNIANLAMGKKANLVTRIAIILAIKLVVIIENDIEDIAIFRKDNTGGL
jgi:hypothetical protein